MKLPARVTHDCLIPLIAVLLCFIRNGNAALRGRTAMQRRLQDCLVCKLSVVDVQYENPGQGPEKLYKCLTGNETEPYSDEELAHDIVLPLYFLEAHRVEIDGGLMSLCIPGGVAIHEEGSFPYIFIPTGSEISIIHDLQFGADIAFGSTPSRIIGQRSILVVRVLTATEAPGVSKDEVEGAVFGTGPQPIGNSLVSQYKACSFNQLNFNKATPVVNGNAINGVMDLIISGSIAGRDMSTLENEITGYLTAALGGVNPNQFNHVMYCMPRGSTLRGTAGWLAYAYVPGYRSYFSDQWCGRLSGIMHEIGHNLGLAHSSEGSAEYGDQSGYMGYSYAAINGPVMCFNGHKNYILGWYSDKTFEVNLSSAMWSGKIAAIVDYSVARKDRGEYVIVKVGNLHLQYNSQKGFNSGTQERGNMVTITSGTVKSVHSFALAGLVAGQSFTDNGITYQVCEMVSGNPDYALMSIYTSGGVSACTTKSPTAAPTTPAPTSAAPTTPQPTSAAPTTPQPTSAAPTTPLPTSAAPTTPAPTSAAPITPAPTSTAPTTPQPTSAAPITPQPTSAAPTTPLPTSAAPITPAPTSTAPTTPQPTSAAPITPQPTSAAPITPAPTSAAPTTPAPTSAAPTTPAPTSAVPTTPQPTSAVPTTSRTAPNTPASAAPTTRAPLPSPMPVRKKQRKPRTLSNNQRDATLKPSSATAQEAPKPTRLSHKSTKSQSSVTSLESSPSAVPSLESTAPTAGMTEECDDSETGTFLVMGATRNCAWLRARPNQMALLCIAGQPAYDLCEETCGKCFDACEDNEGQSFFVSSRFQYQTCSWLRARSTWKARLCVPGHAAWSICGGTCNSCDAIT